MLVRCPCARNDMNLVNLDGWVCVVCGVQIKGPQPAEDGSERHLDVPREVATLWRMTCSDKVDNTLLREYVRRMPRKNRTDWWHGFARRLKIEGF